MTLLEAGPSVGGLVSGWKTKGGKSIEAGKHVYCRFCVLLSMRVWGGWRQHP